MSDSRYSASDIRVHPVPPLIDRSDGTCVREYRYRFESGLPEELALSDLAAMLSHTFQVTDPRDGLAVTVKATVELVPIASNEILVRVGTSTPEEDCAYLYGLRTLPVAIEQKVGRIASIEGSDRSYWPALWALDHPEKGPADPVWPDGLSGTASPGLNGPG